MDILNRINNSIPRNNNDHTNRVVPVEETEPLSKQFASITGNIQQAANDSMMKMKNKIDGAADDLKKGFNGLDDKVKSMFKQYSYQINNWARHLVQTQVIIVLEKMRPIAKNSLKDPEMCQCVKNLIDDIVDDAYPELIDEVKYQMMLQFSDPYVEIEDKQTFCLFYPFVWMRNHYLYAMQPYDRTFWKQVKSISWWFWTLVSAIPFYGVSQFFFVWDFIMRDKQDEYQLVDFILSFKTMLFLTQGIEKAVIGYFQLYACTTMQYTSSNTYTDNCTRKGPGASIEVFSEVIGQFCQIFFTWLAFILLTCSKQKGKPRFKYEDEVVEEGCFERGGRLKYFMIWDLFALGASIGLFWLVYLLQYRPDFNNSGDFIYFTEICYGFLSFPFLLFKVPILSGRLTKAKATAYDRKGNCLPTDHKLKQEKKPVLDEKTSLLASLSIDVNEVFDG